MCFSVAHNIERLAEAGARGADEHVRTDASLLPTALRQSVVSRSADTSRVYEATSGLHQLHHQERDAAGLG